MDQINFLLFKKMKKKSQANETFVQNIRKSILRNDVVLWFVKINEVLYSKMLHYIILRNEFT